MPIEDLLDHPRAIALPSAGRGMLFDLIAHFWLTECKPLPTDNESLRAIVRAHKPTWRNHEADIRAVIADLQPLLAQAWRNRAAIKDQLRHLSARRHGKAKLERLTRSETSTPLPLTPKHGFRRKEKLAAERFAASQEAGDGFSDT